MDASEESTACYNLKNIYRFRRWRWLDSPRRGARIPKLDSQKLFKCSRFCCWYRVIKCMYYLNCQQKRLMQRSSQLTVWRTGSVIHSNSFRRKRQAYHLQNDAFCSEQACYTTDKRRKSELSSSDLLFAELSLQIWKVCIAKIRIYAEDFLLF